MVVCSVKQLKTNQVRTSDHRFLQYWKFLSANNAKNETPEDKVTLIANSFIHEIHNQTSLLWSKCRTMVVDDGTTSGVSGRKLADRIKELGGRAMSIRRLLH